MQRTPLTTSQISPLQFVAVVFSDSNIQQVQQSLSNDPDLAPDEEAEVKHREEMLDEALETTFPASDAVSLSAQLPWRVETAHLE